MSLGAVVPTSGAARKVAVVALDPRRRGELERIVVAAGYSLAQTHDAELVLTLSDRSQGLEGSLTLRTRQMEAAAVLPDDANAEQIDAALHAIAVGLIVRAPLARDRGFERARTRRVHPLLTPRELEILTAISDGLSNKAIAKRLVISQHTVKFHVESLFKKLSVRTRAEAVAKGIERLSEERVEV
jgi:DNA-binding NarL/FixJ family response regulator